MNRFNMRQHPSQLPPAVKNCHYSQFCTKKTYVLLLSYQHKKAELSLADTRKDYHITHRLVTKTGEN